MNVRLNKKHQRTLEAIFSPQIPATLQMKTMIYKGYTAEIIYSDKDECFVGDVVGIDDIICFHGNTDEELRVAFEDVVDLYIEALEKSENPPQKHDAGSFWTRLREVFHL